MTEREPERGENVSANWGDLIAQSQDHQFSYFSLTARSPGRISNQNKWPSIGQAGTLRFSLEDVKLVEAKPSQS